MAISNTSQQVLIRISAQDVNTAGTLNRIQATMNQVAGELDRNAQNVGRSFDSMAERMRHAGVQMTVAGAGMKFAFQPAVNFLKDTITVGADFEAQMLRTLGVFSSELETQAQQIEARSRLMDEANRVGVKYALSNIEAAEALEMLGKMGRSTTEAIAELEPVTQFAEANNYDLAKSAELVAVAMSIFEEQGFSAKDVVGQLTAAQLNSAQAMEDITVAFRHGAGAVAAVNVPMNEYVAALGIAANEGVKGAMAGTQFRSMLTRMIKPTAEARDLIRELGINWFEAGTTAEDVVMPVWELEKQLNSLFGTMTKAEKQNTLLSLLNDLGLATTDITGKTLTATDAQKKFLDAYRNMDFENAEQIDEASQIMANYGIEMFDLRGKMKPLPELFAHLNEQMAGLSDTQKQAVLTTLFTQRGFQIVNALMGANSEEWAEMIGNVDNGTAALQRMTDLVQSGVAYAFEVLSGNIEVLKTEIFEVIKGPLEAIVQSIIRMTEAFIASNPAVKILVATLLTLGAFLGAVVGPMALFVGLLLTSFGSTTLAAFAAITGILVVLGGVFATLATRTEEFRAAVEPANAALQLLIATLSGGATAGEGDFFGGITDVIGSGIIAAVGALARAFQLLVDIILTVRQVLNGDWAPSSQIHPLTNAIGIATQLAIRFFVALGNLGNYIGTTLGPHFQRLSDWITGLNSNGALTDFITTIGTLLVGAALLGLQALEDFAYAAVDALDVFLQWFGDDAFPVIEAFFNGLYDFTTGTAIPAITGFVDGALGQFQRFVNWFSSDVQPVVSGWWSGVTGFIETNVIPPLTTAVDTVVEQFDRVKNWFTGDDLSSVAPEYWAELGPNPDMSGFDSFKETLKNIISEDVISTITSAVDRVLEQFNRIKNWFTGTETPNVAPEFWAELGPNVGESGFSQAIVKVEDLIPEEVITGVQLAVDRILEQLDRLKEWSFGADGGPAIDFSALGEEIVMPESTGFEQFVSEAQGHLETFFGFVNQHKQTLGGIALAIASFFGAFRLAKVVVPVIATMAPSFTGLAGAASRLANLAAPVQKFFDDLGVELGIVASKVPILGGSLSNLALAFGISAAGIPKLIGLLAALGVSTGGIALVVAGLATTIGILTLGWTQNWGNVQESSGSAIGFVSDLLSSTLQPALSVLSDTILPNLTNSWNTIVGVFNSTFGPVYALQNLWESLQNVFIAIQPVLQVLGVALGVVLVAAIGILLGLLNGLATAAGPVLGGVLVALSGIINIVSGAFNVLAGVINIIVGVVQIFVSVITALITGDFIGAFEGIKTGFQTILTGVHQIFIGVSQIVVGLVQVVLGLIGGLVGGVIGLISGFVQGIIDFFVRLYNELVGNSIIPDLVNGIIEWISKLPGEVLGIISDFVTSVIEFFVDLAADVIETVSTFIGDVITEFGRIVSEGVQFFSDFASDAWQAISDFATDAWDTISGFVGDFITEVGRILSEGLTPVTDFASQAWDAISGFVGDAWESISGFVGDVVTEFARFISEALVSVTTFGTDAFTAISTFVTDAWTSISTFVTDFITELGRIVTEGVQKIKDFAYDVGVEMLLLIIAGYTWATDFVGEFLNGMVTKFVEVITEVGTWGAKILAGIGEVGNLLYDKGLSIGQGLYNGIKDGAGKFFGAIGDLGSGAIDTFGSVVQSQSPSKVFEQFGRWLTEGLSIGVSEGEADAVKAVADAANAILDTAKAVYELSEILSTERLMPIDPEKMKAIANQGAEAFHILGEAIAGLATDEDTQKAYTGRVDMVTAAVDAFKTIFELLESISENENAVRTSTEAIGRLKLALERAIDELHLMFNYLGDEKIGNSAMAVSSAQMIGEGLTAIVELLVAMSEWGGYVNFEGIGQLKLALERAIDELHLMFSYLGTDKIMNATQAIAIAKDIGEGFSAIIEMVVDISRMGQSATVDIDEIGQLKLVLERAIQELAWMFDYFQQDEIQKAGKAAAVADEIGKGFEAIVKFIRLLAKNSTIAFDADKIDDIVHVLEVSVKALGDAFLRVGQPFIDNARVFAESGKATAEALIETFRFLSSASKVGVQELPPQLIDNLVDTLTTMIQKLSAALVDIDYSLLEPSKHAAETGKEVAEALLSIFELFQELGENPLIATADATINVLIDTLIAIMVRFDEALRTNFGPIDEETLLLIGAFGESAESVMASIGAVFDVFTMSTENLQQRINDLPTESIVKDLALFIDTLVSAFEEVAVFYQDSSLELTSTFADTSNTIIDAISAIPDALTAIASFKAPSEKKVSAVISFITYVTEQLITIANDFDGRIDETAKLFVETAGNILDAFASIPDAMEGIKSLIPLTENKMEQIKKFFIKLGETFLEIARSFTETDLLEIQAYVNTIKSALDLLESVSKDVKETGVSTGNSISSAGNSISVGARTAAGQISDSAQTLQKAAAEIDKSLGGGFMPDGGMFPAGSKKIDDIWQEYTNGVGKYQIFPGGLMYMRAEDGTTPFTKALKVMEEAGQTSSIIYKHMKYMQDKFEGTGILQVDQILEQLAWSTGGNFSSEADRDAYMQEVASMSAAQAGMLAHIRQLGIVVAGVSQNLDLFRVGDLFDNIEKNYGLSKHLVKQAFFGLTEVSYDIPGFEKGFLVSKAADAATAAAFVKQYGDLITDEMKNSMPKNVFGFSSGAGAMKMFRKMMSDPTMPWNQPEFTEAELIAWVREQMLTGKEPLAKTFKGVQLFTREQIKKAEELGGELGKSYLRAVYGLEEYRAYLFDRPATTFKLSDSAGSSAIKKGMGGLQGIADQAQNIMAQIKSMAENGTKLTAQSILSIMGNFQTNYGSLQTIISGSSKMIKQQMRDIQEDIKLANISGASFNNDQLKALGISDRMIVGTINLGGVTVTGTGDPLLDGALAGQAAMKALIEELEARNT